MALWTGVEDWLGAAWIGIEADVETRVDLPDDSGEIKPSGDAGRLITPANRWYAFARDWTLEQAPEQVTMRIGAESKYWLWINGELVVYEGGLKRGPSPDATYVDEIEMGAFLQRGANQIRVLLWHFGKQGFSHHNAGRAGLIVLAQSGDELLVSDAKWRVANVPAFTTSPDLVPNYRLPESSIRYDARLTRSSWLGGPSEDLDWHAADSLCEAGASPFGQLVSRPTPQWRMSEPVDFPDALKAPWTSSGEELRLALPHNGHFHPRFSLSVPPEAEGAIVRMRTDHYHGGGPASLGAEYVCARGDHEFEAPGWINGHQLLLEVPAGVTVRAIGFRESRYDSDVVGHFSCSDESLTSLWQKACRTLLVCMRDSFMDCPDRERAQWWGDEVIQLHQCFYALDPQSHRLIEKGIRELAAWQREDGSIYSPIPSGNWHRELPMQMLLSIGHGLNTYYVHSGDLRTVRDVLPYFLRYLRLWEQDPDGLVLHRPGEWTWGDWGPNKDMDLLYQGHFALALSRLTDLCGAADMTSEAQALRARYNALRASYDKTFWSDADAAFRGRDHTGPIDDRGQALAVVAGLVHDDRRDAIAEKLETQRFASPFSEYLVDEALRILGRGAQALARMRERFAAMIASPHTTLWEGWDIGSREYGGGTANHAWSGGPLVALSAGVAGVRPTAPGYAQISIAPQPGDLRRVETSLESVRGRIGVLVDSVAQTITCATPSPAQVTVPPEWPGTRLTISRTDAQGPEQRVDLSSGQSRSVGLDAGSWLVRLE